MLGGIDLGVGRQQYPNLCVGVMEGWVWAGCEGSGHSGRGTEHSQPPW